MSIDTNKLFVDWIKNIAIYLLQCTASHREHRCAWQEYRKIDSIYMYDRYILKEGCKGHYFCCPMPNSLEYICIAGTKGKNPTFYVKSLIENIFPLWEFQAADYSTFRGDYYNDYPPPLPYQAGNIPIGKYLNVSYAVNTMISQGIPLHWRDDSVFPQDVEKVFFESVVKRLSERDLKTKSYCLFWNLFLLALDDDLYHDKVSSVMDLSQKLGFNESMMRDWCHAVEYVLAGNMLSENCDLQCETEEGKAFFLHKSNS